MLDAVANPRRESTPRREIAWGSIFSLILSPPSSVLHGFWIVEDWYAKLTLTAREWFLSLDASEALCRRAPPILPLSSAFEARFRSLTVTSGARWLLSAMTIDNMRAHGVNMSDASRYRGGGVVVDVSLKA